jgi:hypothetical protein
VVENRTPVKEKGVCSNPKVLVLMDRWLATAVPAGKSSAKRRFDAWGNIDGVDFDKAARDKAGLPPKAKIRRCAHLWKVAAQLKSDNQGTLKEFVEKNQ